MFTILNLTQHQASAEQVEAGVVEPSDKGAVASLLDFADQPDQAEIWRRARQLAAIARHEQAEVAMIGGAPFLMGPMEVTLVANNVKPVYAFSRRESAEVIQPDGSCRKIAVFRHVGFIDGCATHPSVPPLTTGYLCEGGDQCQHESDSTHWVD